MTAEERLKNKITPLTSEEMPIKIIGGKDLSVQKQERKPQDEILWCKICGEPVGIYNPSEGCYIHDNFCRKCGTKVEAD